jgi:hypothetical protein
LVHTDTGQYPYPVGITTGNALPFAAGDIDADGLTDLVCLNVEQSPAPDTFYCIVMTLESPDSSSYPCSLTWHYRYSDNATIPSPTYFPLDLDGDGHKEIFCATSRAGFCIWENTGNNQNELVWRDTVHLGYSFTFGDFDVDGAMNFASASGGISVWECAGDDQYDFVFRDTVWLSNGFDVFTTNDIDGDSMPEIYVAYEDVPAGKMYLYMWEADQRGSDRYHHMLVDSVWFSGTDWGRESRCGDMDGDGIDECIWTTPDRINVYKAFGNDDLRVVWHWNNDHGGFRSLVSTVYDVNGDGYNELITAGNAKVSVFEFEAVTLLSPNSGTYHAGDTVRIGWVNNPPARCDSLSLFIRRDSLWHFDTIATGILPSQLAYDWAIPDDSLDTCRVVVIAYGPGWQYDISDSAIHILPAGVAEVPRALPKTWALSVSPNPARGAFHVRYDVPENRGQSPGAPASDSARYSPHFRVGIYDVDGRLVQSLADGVVAPGRYRATVSGRIPAGIYFCTLDNGSRRLSRKVVLTE